MWPKLRKQIAVERAMLSQLRQDHLPLLRKCASAAPDAIELSALAAMLHAFYNGVENIFKRVAIEVNGGPPEGERWHRSLLERAAARQPNRPAVISAPLAERLSEYLGFRHFFRSAYPSRLRWERMTGLVVGFEETLRRLEDELDAFLAGAPD